MPKYKRLCYLNATYHIYARGNNRLAILKRTNNKEKYITNLIRFKERFKFKLYGYIIMDNHVHLIIQVTYPTTISKIMQSISLSYSHYFRKRYAYTGHVWEGRFKSKIIEGEQYILTCLEYIHNNPVRAGLVKKPEEYLWSSYHMYCLKQDHYAPTGQRFSF